MRQRMVRFTLRLSESQMRALREYAARKGISISAAVRECIDRYVREEGFECIP